VTKRQIALMADHLTMWTANIAELLESLKNTSPESGGLMAEIFYWRDMDRVLDAIVGELRQPFVDKICEAMAVF
jgi:hypothetical protein